MHVPIDCVRTAWIHLLTYIYIYIYTHKEATHCKQRVRNTYTVLTGVPVLMLYSPKRGAVPRQTVHNEPIKQPRELYFEKAISPVIFVQLGSGKTRVQLHSNQICLLRGDNIRNQSLPLITILRHDDENHATER